MLKLEILKRYRHLNFELLNLALRLRSMPGFLKSELGTLFNNPASKANPRVLIVNHAKLPCCNSRYRN